MADSMSPLSAIGGVVGSYLHTHAPRPVSRLTRNNTAEAHLSMTAWVSGSLNATRFKWIYVGVLKTLHR